MNEEQTFCWLRRRKLLDLAKLSSVYLKKVFHECLGTGNEQLLIIGDVGSKNQNISSVLSYAYYLAAEKLRIKNKLVIQHMETRGKKADKEVVDALSELPDGSIIILNLSDRLGSIGKLGKSFRKFCKKRKHRFASTTSLGYLNTNKTHYITNALDVDYSKLRKLHSDVKKQVDKARKIYITTKAGTELEIDVKGVKSRCSDGNYKTEGTGGNLPAGEVYMYLNNINGKAVIDGSSRNRFNTHLIKKPLNLYIENGIVVKIQDGEKAMLLEKSLEWAAKKAKYPRRVYMIGELGIGLNEKAQMIGTTIVDEKVYGTAHLGIGSNYWFGGPIRTIIHLDQVFKSPEILLDNKPLRL